MFVVGGGAYQYNTSDLIRIGEWSHLLLYRNSGEMSVYVNGIYIYPVVTGSGALDLNANTQFTIGSRATTEYFTGSIANFRLFNRALTTDEIYQLYAYQKEYFGHGNLGMTLKAGRLGIGTSEPRAALDVRGDIYGGCPVYFAAYNTSGTTAGDTVVWDSLWISRGGGFDTSTGEFTTPLAGVYKFYYTLRQSGVTASSLWARVQLNGADINGDYGSIYLQTSRDQAGSTVLLKLNAGDNISIKVYNYNMSSSYNSFVGEYLSSL